MNDLKVWEFEMEDASLARTIREFNKQVDQLGELEAALKEKRRRLDGEIYFSDSMEDQRPVGSVIDELHELRIEQLEATRRRYKLLDQRLTVLNQMLGYKQAEQDQTHQAIESAIQKAKKQLTKAGSGIETIRAQNGRMIEVNPKAAEIQFTHRARQTTTVQPFIQKEAEIEGEISAIRSHLKLTQDELRKTGESIKRQWQSFAGMAGLVGSHD